MSVADLLGGHAVPQDESSGIPVTSDVQCAEASIADMLGNAIIFVVLLPCILVFVCKYLLFL